MISSTTASSVTGSASISSITATSATSGLASMAAASSSSATTGCNPDCVVGSGLDDGLV